MFAVGAALCTRHALGDGAGQIHGQVQAGQQALQHQQLVGLYTPLHRQALDIVFALLVFYLPRKISLARVLRGGNLEPKNRLGPDRILARDGIAARIVVQNHAGPIQPPAQQPFGLRPVALAGERIGQHALALDNGGGSHRSRSHHDQGRYHGHALLPGHALGQGLAAPIEIWTPNHGSITTLR